ncbi:MAG: tRNA (guanine(46)-N(7))-methyltransferase TrmB [Acidimicrobiales bacterium]|nr:tRNA (guanine(46)-N(7))-methyltransferase TrmB [Acidimicrobiales bacterium]
MEVPADADADAERWRGTRVRTFHGRHGRVTERMQSVLDEAGPRFGLDHRADEGRPLVVEIGCGHGDAALAFCDAHPDADLLAVDVHTPGIVRLLEERTAGRAPNLFVERADGVDVLDHRLTAPGDLAGLHLFFPDPWPKARHHKRRFVRPDVLDLVADRLAPGAPLRIATDVADYVDWAIHHLDAHPAFTGGPGERPPWRPVTRYEQAGLDAGRRPVDLCYRRR